MQIFVGGLSLKYVERITLISIPIETRSEIERSFELIKNNELCGKIDDKLDYFFSRYIIPGFRRRSHLLIFYYKIAGIFPFMRAKAYEYKAHKSTVVKNDVSKIQCDITVNAILPSIL